MLTYLNTILMLFFVLALAVLVRLEKDRKRILFILFFYIVVIISVTLIFRDSPNERRIMINPLEKYIQIGKSMSTNISKAGPAGVLRSIQARRYMIVEILLNILLFVPIGYMVPAVKNGRWSWYIVLIIGFGFSLLVEITQFIFRFGFFDVSDLLHNTLGVIVGYVIYQKWMKTSQSMER